jgi:hypothetical protein
VLLPNAEYWISVFSHNSHLRQRYWVEVATGLAANPRKISRLRASLARDHSLISPMVRRQPMHSPCASRRQMSMQGESTGVPAGASSLNALSLNVSSTIAE